MQYHPHGDASIGRSPCQHGAEGPAHRYPGQTGEDVRTGDDAAALSRYIEARLSKFALESGLLICKRPPNGQLSYDGRKK